MDKLWDFSNAHPVVFFSVCAFAFFVALMLVAKVLIGKPKMIGTGMPVESEENDKPEMTRITILASDGKVIEEVVVETDSINYDDGHGSYLSYENADGKNVVYMLGTHSAKMTDL